MKNPLYKFINGKRVKALEDKECLVCKKIFTPSVTKAKYCGRECYYKMKRIRGDRVKWTDEMRLRMSKSKMGKKNPRYGIGVYPKGTKLPERQGENHPNWKGGYSVSPNGYKVFESEKYTKGKKIAEHRFVMEKHLGRKLLSKEIIHHINHNKLDNRIENLMIVDRATHIKIHPPKKLGYAL